MKRTHFSVKTTKKVVSVNKTKKKLVSVKSKVKYYSRFSDLKKFYDRRENPTEEDLKKQGFKNIFDIFYNGLAVMDKIYNTPFIVKAYVQRPNKEIAEGPAQLKIKLMDEESNIVGFGNGVYLGEFDNYSEYNFPDNRIKVKKYKNDEILVFHKNTVPVTGGKMKKYRKSKVFTRKHKLK